MILEIKALIAHYERNREELQVVSESGKLFKKSVDKDNSKMEFVPVNLHIQELKHAPSSEKRGYDTTPTHTTPIIFIISYPLNRESCLFVYHCWMSISL